MRVKPFFNIFRKNSGDFLLSYCFSGISSRKKEEKGGSLRRRRKKLSFAEGLAVGALIHSGICLVGAYQDLVQGAVVLGIAVVSAGLDGAFDALVGIVIHSILPPFF